ncbi:MAG: putative manganese-dependent inorganic diphosphatase [Verrucomicrobiales bacterium]
MKSAKKSAAAEPAAAAAPAAPAEPNARPLYVIGHRNPDTDAICSAIGYADFLRRTGVPEALPACCGEINARTAWVLEQAGVAKPRLLLDVRPTAATICQRNVSKARVDETFLEVYQRMARSAFRSIPVVDREGSVVGMPTVQELLQLLLPVGEMRERARHVRTSLANIVKALEGAMIAAGDPPTREEDIVLLVAASSEDTIWNRMAETDPRRIIVMAGDRPAVHLLAIEAGVRCLVLTGGFQLDPKFHAKAAKNGVSIVTCSQDTASAAQLIRCSRSIGDSVSADFLSFTENTRVTEIVRQVAASHQPLFPVFKAGTRQLAGVFSKSDLVSPPRVRLVLVDHNEFSQTVAGADEADIVEVIDHHRLSGHLVTKTPIRFVNEPVGSTSTIVGRFYRQAQLEPPPDVAVCLCAGIISDTLNLTSPTATEVDREILAWLAQIGGVDVESFTKGFFAAGSLLKDCAPTEALESDRKEFEESGWRLSISQIEELGLSYFWDQEKALAEELEKLRKKRKLHLACLMVTDVTQHFSVLLACGDKRLLERIEYPEKRAGLYEMPGVVSRKKQLFPHIGRAVAGVERE